jgi:hypothetical protein
MLEHMFEVKVRQTETPNTGFSVLRLSPRMVDVMYRQTVLARVAALGSGASQEEVEAPAAQEASMRPPTTPFLATRPVPAQMSPSRKAFVSSAWAERPVNAVVGAPPRSPECSPAGVRGQKPFQHGPVQHEPFAEESRWWPVEDRVLNPADPEDAETLTTELCAAGLLTEELVAALGWDDPVEEFDHADVIATQIEDLDEDGLLMEIQSAHRGTARAQARLFLLVTELAQRRAANAVTQLTGRHARGREALSIGARAVTEEVGLELGLSRSEAGNLTDTALGLCLEAPDTLQALLRGDLSLAKAETIVRLTQSLVAAQEDTNADLDPKDQVDPQKLGKDLEAELLKGAAKQTTTNLRKAGERAQIRANPKAAECRHRVKRARRHFAYIPDADSMCRLSAYLPADQGMTAKNALTRLAYHARANRGSGDTRTLDQLRVDTLVETLTRASDNLHSGSSSNGNGGEASSDMGSSESQEARNRTGTRDDDVETPGDAGVPSTGDGPHRADAPSTTDDGAREDAQDDGDRKAMHSNRNGSESNNTETSGTRAGHAQPSEKDTTESQTGQGGRFRSRSSTVDPRVLITISASTLTGDDDQPGHLQGHGPIVASMARQVAATGTWRCAIVDDTHGTLLGLGTSTYTPNYKPTERLRRHLFARDRVCRVPGCNAPAELCDVDHCTPWPAGATCECSTECLCGNHHRIKHETGFSLTPSTNPNDPPDTLVWTTPAGHQYLSYPSVLQDPPTSTSGGPGIPTPTDTPSTPATVIGTSTTGQTGTTSTNSTTGATGATGQTSTTSTTSTGEIPLAPGFPRTESHAGECRACNEADTTITAENQTYPDPTRPTATATTAGSSPTSSPGQGRHPRADDPNDDAFEYEKPGDETGESDGFRSRLRPSYIHTLASLPIPRDGDPPPF